MPHSVSEFIRFYNSPFSYWCNKTNKLVDEKKIDAKYKIIVGYCGWAPGQLESEIKQNSWHIISSDMNLVFDTLPNLVVDKLSEKIGYNLRTIIRGENSH